ncbi:MAG TPA: hypothetical protein VEX70_04235 [Pyrinomonadaceae bacterium]|jgi:hypothetical protein|nr:hypothetical protein [Pyrinomonadaceae bacterium]
MSTQNLTLEELRRAGIEALTRELGAAGMARFLQQFETGWGDYSVERHQWLDQGNVQTLAEQIRQRRSNESS